jgi:hypothetical protein
MTTQLKNIQSKAWFAAAILAPAVLLGLAWRFGELWFRTYAAALLRGASFGLTIIVVGLTAAGAGAVLLFGGHPDRDHYRYGYREEKEPQTEKSRRARNGSGIALMAFAAAWFLLPGGVVPGMRLGASMIARHGHDVRVENLSGNIVETDQTRPTWLARANSVQAQRMVNQYLSDPSVGGVTEIQRSSVNGNPSWCAAALNVPDRLGRQYVNLVVCMDDEKQLTTAKFTGQAPSIQGSFSSNLRKKVAEMEPGLMLADEDVRYGIRDGRPFMVAAATRYTGWFTNLTVPAGVVLMDESGEIRIADSLTSEEFDVPVLPVAVARNLRSTLNDRGGYWCLNHLGKAKCLDRNTPFEDSQSAAGTKVESDVNAENYSEFTLQREDGTWVYVTPMTYYGRGRTITGYFEVMAGASRAGEIPSATLFVGMNEVSHLALVQALTPTYTSDLNWIGEVAGDGDTSTASRIYEVTPTKPGISRLTIGTATNPQYLVDVSGSLSGDDLDFSWCISTDPEKKGEKPRLIECRRRSDGEAPIGTLRGLASATAPTSGGNESTPITDPSPLTETQLLELIEAAARELARR